jgi:nucleoside-diphosphate-sugar epimerase
MVNKILLTGGSSPIGSYFIERLTAEFPTAEIIATYSRNMPLLNRPGLNWYQVDFSKDLSQDIWSDLKDQDIVIHLASLTPGNNQNPDPDIYYKANVRGPINLIKSLSSSKIPKIFYLSSSAVYNRTRGNSLNELSDKTITDSYGLSKLMFEHEIFYLYNFIRTPSLGLRVPVLLTKGVKYNFISKWKYGISNRQELQISSPDATFNAVCPDFAIYDAFKLWLMSNPDSPTVLNIAAEIPTTLRAILNKIKYPYWKEVVAATPAQTIYNLQPSKFITQYNALEVVSDFLS